MKGIMLHSSMESFSNFSQNSNFDELFFQLLPGGQIARDLFPNFPDGIREFSPELLLLSTRTHYFQIFKYSLIERVYSIIYMVEGAGMGNNQMSVKFFFLLFANWLVWVWEEMQGAFSLLISCMVICWIGHMYIYRHDCCMLHNRNSTPALPTLLPPKCRKAGLYEDKLGHSIEHW